MSGTRRRSPSSFPVRLIHLYTYPDDLVSTRSWVWDERGGGDPDRPPLRRLRHRPRVRRARPERAALETEKYEREASKRDEIGDPARPTAREVVAAMLADAGFGEVERDPRLPAGLDVSLSAHDRSGARWYFDVAGGFTSSRPG